MDICPWTLLAAQHLTPFVFEEDHKMGGRKLRGADTLRLSSLEARTRPLTDTQQAGVPIWGSDPGRRQTKGRVVRNGSQWL